MPSVNSSATAPAARKGATRIALYYVLLGVLVLVAVRYIPLISEAISGGALLSGGPGAEDILGSGSGSAPAGVPAGSLWHEALLAVVSMAGALAIMIPVTWVYMLTRRHRGYHESVVHTLLVLPVTVTGIVMIVRSSVPLAFSLAGIVAAVRFRTTLEDTKDAVYVFLAIGVGLASGVQAVGVAFALSVVFNLVILALWTTHFGNIYADRTSGTVDLGDVLAGPESAEQALVVGDPAVLEAAAPRDLAEIADRAVRIERHVSEERAKKRSRRANALLLVHAAQAESAQAYVDQVLDDLAARWKLAEVGPGPEGALLVYLARFDGAAVEGAVMDRLRGDGDGVVRAAELRSLKGIKPRR